ncbi:hypothetical protein [Ligilactobacillus salivarius]|uniref:Esterase n=1 Tax=Ligilactobacillus salivarius TaxID=1624 RepID=A0A1D7TSB4_9LACO|nr:hypothetical protein [Ligilactobacillus salivarius]AOO73856.1 hypothetical protein BHF65_06355 [Ligilactobacillus salivarius]UDE96559.1 hypothetical protein LG631_04550 [Ligilactobacillus salivarius]UUV95686.1 hypothetical protein M3M92_04545 [Ligilactobacillus salivarius]
MYEKIWILLGAVVVLLFIPQMKVYAAKSSRIETVDYTTIYQGKTYHKQAYVYLPENYNKNQNYNILYLTHGYSMGAITTWFVLEYDLKYFSEFVPMAGDSWTVENDGGGIAPKVTAQKLAKAITKQEYKENDFSIYASVGSDDGTRFSMSPQIKSMWKLAIFNQDNLQYWLDKGGNHDMASVIKQLIHAEKQLFKER